MQVFLELSQPLMSGSLNDQSLQFTELSLQERVNDDLVSLNSHLIELQEDLESRIDPLLRPTELVLTHIVSMRELLCRCFRVHSALGRSDTLHLVLLARNHLIHRSHLLLKLKMLLSLPLLC